MCLTPLPDRLSHSARYLYPPESGARWTWNQNTYRLGRHCSVLLVSRADRSLEISFVVVPALGSRAVVLRCCDRSTRAWCQGLWEECGSVTALMVDVQHGVVFRILLRSTDYVSDLVRREGGLWGSLSPTIGSYCLDLSSSSLIVITSLTIL